MGAWEKTCRTKKMNKGLEPALKRLRRNFNKFIQMRDIWITQEDEIIAECVACGRAWILNNTYDWKDFHASHYWLEDKYASVRFNEHNVNGCCSVCNKHLSGNLAMYEMSLIEKIGNENFEKLGVLRNQIKKYDVVDLGQMNKHYLEAIRFLTNTKFKNTYIGVK